MLFCRECNIEITSLANHNRTLRHRRNCVSYFEPNIKLVNTAYKQRLKTYHIYGIGNGLKNNVIRLLEKEQGWKIQANLELYGSYILPSKHEEDVKSFNTRYSIITASTDLDSFYEEYKNIMLKKAYGFNEKQSGWALSKLLFLELNINKVK